MVEEGDVIWRMVRDANEAWTGGRPSDTAALFHSDVVMLGPTGGVLSEGREAMDKSFVEYCENATTHRFREVGREVRVFGAAAVVTYDFEIEYEFEGRRHAESGRELLVFARDDGKWCAITRMQLQSDPM